MGQGCARLLIAVLPAAVPCSPCTGGSDPTKFVPAQETPIGPIIGPPNTTPTQPSDETEPTL